MVFSNLLTALCLFQIYGLLCLNKKSHIKTLIKIINPSGLKLIKNEEISLEHVNLKSKISKYHQATYFMSKIGKTTNNVFYLV